MPRFKATYNFLLLFVLSASFGLSAHGQTSPEKPAYRNTLSPERQEAYRQAEARYLSEPPASIPVTSNRRLADTYAGVLAIPETDTAEVADKIAAFQKLSAEAARKKETYLEMECLYRAFMLAFWSEHRDYSKGFELALVLEEKLSAVTERQYPDCRNVWFRISEAYYLFKDFNKSIELALNAITDEPPRSFTDLANLEGRKILAMAYGMVGDFDRSDVYIRSTWKSWDMVEGRPVFDAMALAHMACNEMDRGNWHKALALNNEVLEYLKTTGDPGHVAGMYACQSFCYYGLGEPEKIGAIADSMLHYASLDTYNRNKRLKQAYANLSRYNGVIGNVPVMQQYQDSLVAIYKQEEDLAASRYIS
ncbi:MAG: hypothetical protein LUF87_01805 [Alistipes sp.]|nr:hypothetical protein [Alistipes sp.]